jgi:hypothetical protein
MSVLRAKQVGLRPNSVFTPESFVILLRPLPPYTFPRRGEKVDDVDSMTSTDSLAELDALLEKYPQSLWSWSGDMTKTYVGPRVKN